MAEGHCAAHGHSPAPRSVRPRGAVWCGRTAAAAACAASRHLWKHMRLEINMPHHHSPPPRSAAHTGGCVGWLAQGASWTHALGTMPWLPGPSRWRCCAWWASTMSAGPQARRPRPPPLRGRHSCPHRTLRLCMGGLPRHAFDFNLQAGIMALRFAAPRQAGSAAGGSACHSACVCASAGADAFWLTTNQPKDLKRSANKRALRRAPSCRTTTNEPAGDALNLCRSGASDTAQTFGSSRLLGLLSRRARATVRA
jgi:hypothetical protein